jgi:predicted DNA-binding protein (MmcQ/YjbR family)
MTDNAIGYGKRSESVQIMLQYGMPPLRQTAPRGTLHNGGLDSMEQDMTRKQASGITAAQLEALCGHWPGVTRDTKWGVDMVLSVGGKMFAVMPSDGSEGGRLSCKVADERFLELTDQPGISPAPYLARAHWISITEPQRFGTAELEAFILDAYVLVRAKLTKKLQATLGALPILKASKK